MTEPNDTTLALQHAVRVICVTCGVTGDHDLMQSIINAWNAGDHAKLAWTFERMVYVPGEGEPNAGEARLH